MFWFYLLSFWGKIIKNRRKSYSDKLGLSKPQKHLKSKDFFSQFPQKNRLHLLYRISTFLWEFLKKKPLMWCFFEALGLSENKNYIHTYLLEYRLLGLEWTGSPYTAGMPHSLDDDILCAVSTDISGGGMGFILPLSENLKIKIKIKLALAPKCSK